MIQRTSTKISTTSMAESAPRFIDATTTVISKLSAAKFKLFFFQPHSSSFRPQNQIIRNQNFEKQNSPPHNSIFRPQSTFEVLTSDPNYMLYRQQTQITCHKCGYPSHVATNCRVRKHPPGHGAQNPFNF